MYVKVHKKGNQWFREDNGTLVGTEASLQVPRHQRFNKHLGNDCIILIMFLNEYKTVFKGYLQKDGTLIRDKASNERYVFVLD